MQWLEHLLQFRAWRFRLLYSHLIGVAYGAVEHNIRSICCHQSTVTMRFRAGLTSSKLALFPRSGTTSRTMDSEYLFWADFFFHGEIMSQNRCTRWSILTSCGTRTSTQG